jgi:type II secretory pathway pseudopilin PulG
MTSPVMNRERGMTLPELMVVSLVMFIILAAVSGIYYGCVRIYQRGEPANTAARKAAWALVRMAPDMQQAISVTLPTVEKAEARIVVPEKQQEAGGPTFYNVISLSPDGNPYLARGNEVRYYRGTAGGTPDPNGSTLWRKVIRLDGTSLSPTLITDNVVDNPPPEGLTQPRPLFDYWPDPSFYKCVLMTITVRETKGSQVSTVPMSTWVALRNQG